jgi:hypothetical protein
MGQAGALVLHSLVWSWVEAPAQQLFVADHGRGFNFFGLGRDTQESGSAIESASTLYLAKCFRLNTAFRSC